MFCRKNIHSIACLFLSILIFASLLQGCAGRNNNKETDQQATGKFIQTAINPLSGENLYYTALVQRDNGSLLLTGLEGNGVPFAFTADTEKSWNQLENKEASKFIAQLAKESSYFDFTLLENQTWLISHNKSGPASDNSTERPARTPCLTGFDADGKQIDFDIPSFTDSQTADAQYTIDKILPCSGTVFSVLLVESENYSNAHWITLDAKTGSEISRISMNPQNFAVHSAIIKNRQIYVPGRNNDKLDVYSLETGKQTENLPMPKIDFTVGNVVFCIADNGDFCYADQSGIHRVAKGSSIIQDVVTGTSYVFASPQYMGTGLAALNSGSYMLAAYDENTSGLYDFTFDETAEVSSGSILSIWALEETHLLRSAISAYGEANPETDIRVEYGRASDNSGASDKDIIHTLNTRLIAGDVPDVLILDGLPADTYISKGLLTDLTGEVDVSSCYGNIMQAFVREGKAYAYPANFQMPVFIAKTGDAAAKGIADLPQLAETAAGRDALHYGDYLEMFQALYTAYSQNIFPDAQSLNETALQDFLLYTKQISDSLKLTGENTYEHGGVGDSGIYPRQGISKFSEQGTTYAADIIWDPVQIMLIFLDGDKSITPLPGGCYIPVGCGSIPADARNPKAALGFIKTMLSDSSTQDLRMEQGFSVIIGNYTEYFSKEWEGSAGRPENLDFNGLVSSFTKPAITEKALEGALYEQAELLYKNETTLESACEKVKQNTRIYFEERK